MQAGVVVQSTLPSGRDPLGRLPRDLGDQLDVVVVTQDDESLDVCDGYQDEIGDAHPSVLAAADQIRLELSGSLLGTNWSCDREQMVHEGVPGRGVVARRP